jgi:cytochrome P450
MTRGVSLDAKHTALQEIFGYLESWLKERGEHPGDDLISRILQLRVDDRPLTHEEALSECALVLFGGLDTVAGTMAFFARYLATHPEHRRALAEHPERIPGAIEELLRRHSIPTVGRVLTQDVTLDGVTMKAGDYVQLTTCFHGLDERKWQDPLAVDFNRPGLAGHMAFGRGVHKCPGANLARSELRVFLEEWLKRIADFQIKPGEESVTATGSVAGVLRLPLQWPV